MSTYDQLKALIVEDNPHMRTLLKTLLNAIGIRRVYQAVDGAVGLSVLRECNPDFVLTDLSMKPMDGIEFTHHVRNGHDSRNPYVPIVMVTGHTERQRILAARDAGVTEILAKPITAQNLMRRITEVADKPRPFVRCDNYFGPDRRRHVDDHYLGPWRRHDDAQREMTEV
jgi:two-component system, chemotaxis family, chemotaxis protein CheY